LIPARTGGRVAQLGQRVEVGVAVGPDCRAVIGAGRRGSLVVDPARWLGRLLVGHTRAVTLDPVALCGFATWQSHDRSGIEKPHAARRE
jgi:hypothetical protein